MIHLVDATRIARSIIKYSWLSIIIVFLIFILIKVLIVLKDSIAPPAPAPPEQGFGKLPKIEFPAQQGKVVYNINTVSGDLPIFPYKLNVYKINKNSPNLLSIELARSKLSSLGFNKNEVKVSDTIYRWTNSKLQPERYIDYDIVSGNFDIYSNYFDNKSILLAKNLPGEDKAKNVALDFISALGNNTESIDIQKSTVSYFKILDKNLLPIDGFHEAQIVKVNLFQKSIDNLDIFYPYITGTVVNFTIGSIDGNYIVLNAHFRFQQIDEKISSTYPLKSSAEAFEDLKLGNAFVFNPGNKPAVQITEVGIGYYIGDSDQNYLVPIAIFKGDNFKAYVQLIPNSSITQ